MTDISLKDIWPKYILQLTFDQQILADKHWAKQHLAVLLLAFGQQNAHHCSDAIISLSSPFLHNVGQMSVGQMAFDQNTRHPVGWSCPILISLHEFLWQTIGLGPMLQISLRP
jgi:hypothetical protein